VDCLKLEMHFFPQFLTVGVVVIGVLEILVRRRLRKVGEQSHPFQGGLFAHAKYLRLRRQYHWSGLPVYVIWLVWLAGIGLIFANFLQIH
jgi:hypothetical protein